MQLPANRFAPLACAIILLWGSVATGETGADYNLHLEVGPGFPLSGWQAETLGPGVFGAARFELVLKEWLGLEAGATYLHFFGGDHPAGYRQIDAAAFLAVNAGARFRIVNDDEGYLFPWKKRPDHTGNLHGNLWADLHLAYFRTGDSNRFGGDAGLGYEVSIADGLQIGPFARCTYIYQPDSVNERDSSDLWILLAGLSGSVAFPFDGRRMSDTDGDGFYDPRDTCPAAAEDPDGFQDEDGCPDEDNDGDQLADVVDGCPMVPEDRDGFEDGDGCPDEDNDKDGVPDALDKCPDVAEDRDEYEDEDGCPEDDNDGDGLRDLQDMCPNQAEVVNGLDDDDGCPDSALVEVRNRQILGGERIYFDFGLARVKTRSRELLKQLARLLDAHPEYKLVSIEGNADNRGPADVNEKLSAMRAQRVKQYMVGLGISQDRLIVRGMGESNPWKKGYDDGALAKNRRVEFYIEEIEGDEPQTPVEGSQP